jgi:hypothetical protein
MSNFAQTRPVHERTFYCFSQTGGMPRAFRSVGRERATISIFITAVEKESSFSKTEESP